MTRPAQHQEPVNVSFMKCRVMPSRSYSACKASLWWWNFPYIYTIPCVCSYTYYVHSYICSRPSHAGNYNKQKQKRWLCGTLTTLLISFTVLTMGGARAFGYFIYPTGQHRSHSIEQGDTVDLGTYDSSCYSKIDVSNSLNMAQ